MEVHHHPDLHHKKKKFKEYFFEFLMIFLAVTLGFFAENLRENISEKKQVHEYVQSMISDLQNDLALYDSSMAFNLSHLNMIDTIITSLNQQKNNTAEIYYDARKLTMGSSIVSPDSKTFEQMKSSNGFRLIKNIAVANSIAEYYQWIKKFDYWSDLQKQRLTDVIEINDKIFNATSLFFVLKQMARNDTSKQFSSQNHFRLLTNDSSATNSVIMRYQYYYGMLILMNQRIALASAEAKQLSSLLKKEYGLSNEWPNKNN